MKQSIKDYIEEIDDKINSEAEFDKLKEEHLIKIGFYQHERLIHLLVTLFYALFLGLFILLSYYNPLFIFIVIILMIFLICYVKHYFYLENHVQYMYKQYDMILEKIQKNN